MKKSIKLQKLSAIDIGKFYLISSVPYLMFLFAIAFVFSNVLLTSADPRLVSLMESLGEFDSKTILWMSLALGGALLFNFLFGIVFGFFVNVALKFSGGIRLSGQKLKA